ncbi:MAG: 7-carboxy-7-deazaguanine synthase QueE [Steroidobacteraceae bacterium]
MSAAAPTVLAPATQRSTRLKLTEVFLSLQGESDSVGWPTVFVRLTGCPLRCQYCDTQYAFYGGEWFALDDVVARVTAFGVKHVCVTGGEPLAQKSVLELMRRLCDLDHHVSLETSGALSIADVDARVMRVLDIKTPGSGEAARNRWENLTALRPEEQIKFVLCGRADYEWARALVSERQLDRICTVLFSPSFGELAPGDLAEWMLADRLPVRFQLQLHKVLWGDTPGR